MEGRRGGIIIGPLFETIVELLCLLVIIHLRSTHTYTYTCVGTQNDRVLNKCTLSSSVVRCMKYVHSHTSTAHIQVQSISMHGPVSSPIYDV